MFWNSFLINKKVNFPDQDLYNTHVIACIIIVRRSRLFFLIKTLKSLHTPARFAVASSENGKTSKKTEHGETTRYAFAFSLKFYRLPMTRAENALGVSRFFIITQHAIYRVMVYF